MADSQRRTANLFDKDNADTQNIYVYTGETTVRYNQNTISIVFPCKASTTYSISKIVSSRFAIGFTNAYPQNGTAAYGIIADNSATTLSITTGAVASHIVIFVSYIPAETRSIQEIVESIMINEGSTALPYEPYWKHSLRKLGTATEAVENPLYSDGTAITAYTIKGNTVQNGTPTPSNPVMPNGVGERTENIFDDHNVISIRNLGDRYGVILPDGVYSIYNDTPNQVIIGINDFQSREVACDAHSTATVTLNNSFFGNDAGFYLPLNASSQGGCTVVTGSTPPDHYIPYGYKIPIPSGGVTTNIYLGSTQTVRQIRKVVLNGQENWGKSASTSTFYMNPTGLNVQHKLAISDRFEYTGETKGSYGTFYAPTTDLPQFNFVWDTTKTVDEWKAWLADNPVTVWYVRATPETATVNEPLMKIGDYADTLSNAVSIPTTEGANSITVDTTVQPSEFAATWTGWHDAEVKEKSENLFDNEIASGFYNDSGVLVDDSTTSHSTTYIPVDGTTYTISGLWTAATNFAVYEWDTNKNWLRRSNRQVPSSSTLTFSIGSDTAFITLQIKTEHGNLMLNTGSTAKPYEPYWK